MTGEQVDPRLDPELRQLAGKRQVAVQPGFQAVNPAHGQVGLEGVAGPGRGHGAQGHGRAEHLAHALRGEEEQGQFRQGERRVGVTAHAFAPEDGLAQRDVGQPAERRPPVGQGDARQVRGAGLLPGRRRQAAALPGLREVDLLADGVLEQEAVAGVARVGHGPSLG